MMKTLILVAAVLAVSGCAAVQAKSPDGKRYTCVPNSAMDRGPFQPEPAAGTAMTVSGAPEAVAQK